MTFQVGANDNETIVDLVPQPVGHARHRVVNLATATLGDIDTAIDGVTALRSGFGAIQNRLEHALSVTCVYQENLTSAESRIRDVDMADEMVDPDQEPDPAAGRHGHAGSGQPGPAGSPQLLRAPSSGRVPPDPAAPTLLYLNSRISEIATWSLPGGSLVIHTR